jgi:CBS domain-containing protein
MRDGDGVLCFSFRADHVREILIALLDPRLSDFPRRRPVRICRGRVATKKAKAWARLDPAQTGMVYRRQLCFGQLGLRGRPRNAPAYSKDMLMNVSDIMRRSFATIKPDAPLLDAAHLLIETNQRGLPVIDHDGALVGVISEGDFLHRTELDINPPRGNWLEELLGIEEGTPARRRMQAQLVREVMAPDPICVDEEATLDEVVALMDARHIAQSPSSAVVPWSVSLAVLSW